MTLSTKPQKLCKAAVYYEHQDYIELIIGPLAVSTSFWPLPGLELTWISGNRSLHAELHWLLWEGKVNVFLKERKPKYEEFTTKHHRHVHDVAAFLGECKQCGRPKSDPLHLHPDKVWTKEDVAAEGPPPMLGTIASILHAALMVDWDAEMYTENRWPGTLFVEPSEGIDGLSLRQAIEPYRCIGVLIRFVGVETPELPWKEFYE